MVPTLPMNEDQVSHSKQVILNAKGLTVLADTIRLSGLTACHRRASNTRQIAKGRAGDSVPH